MAKKIVDEHPFVPVKSGGVRVNEEMVCEAKGIMRELWPEEFGDIPLDEEERKFLLRARIREIKGWNTPEEEKKEWRRFQLNELLNEIWGPYIPGSDMVGTKISAQLTSRRPVLRLIQGGRTS